MEWDGPSAAVLMMSAFTSALIRGFEYKYGFDKNRIYSCGMSNGGFMSYTLACELNNKIAAIASVTAAWFLEK
ncbi:MAG: hypothetical protein IPO92_24085 [Saprospiraceae bacterium]|nr:hypothetical protein [Saprospiraceae bacterium]